MTANGRSNGRVNASLFGISDTEILGMVDDMADENGWATTYDVRLQLGEDIESTERSGVGTRLGWLRRFGWLERGDARRYERYDGSFTTTATWRLTAMGNTLLDHPDLSRGIENALAKLNPAQRLVLTRELGEAGFDAAPEIRTALRRQWQRTMLRR